MLGTHIKQIVTDNLSYTTGFAYRDYKQLNICLLRCVKTTIYVVAFLAQEIGSSFIFHNSPYLFVTSSFQLIEYDCCLVLSQITQVVVSMKMSLSLELCPVSFLSPTSCSQPSSLPLFLTCVYWTTGIFNKQIIFF